MTSTATVLSKTSVRHNDTVVLTIFVQYFNRKKECIGSRKLDIIPRDIIPIDFSDDNINAIKATIDVAALVKVMYDKFRKSPVMGAYKYRIVVAPANDGGQGRRRVRNENMVRVTGYRLF